MGELLAHQSRDALHRLCSDAGIDPRADDVERLARLMEHYDSLEPLVDDLNRYHLIRALKRWSCP